MIEHEHENVRVDVRVPENACNCCGVLNWSHSKPFESKKLQQARSMRKCTQKCRLSIERPGVPVTCCDAAWLYGRSPVFVLKSLALWTRHDQRNHDFSTDLSAPDSWLQTILLLVQNSDHGDITVDDRDGVSRSPELGSQVRQVAMVSEPERSKLWDLTCLLFKAQRSVDSSWDQVSQLCRIFTFQESSRFYIRFHSFLKLFFGLKWDIRHNETHAIDESTTTRSSSQLLNLIFCDVLVMSHDVTLWGSSSKTFSLWFPSCMSPFPLSCQSQIGVPAFPLCCSILAIFFLSPFPFASLAFACLFRILFTSFDQATALPEPIAGVKDAHRYMKEKLTLLRWVCCW